MAYGPMNVVHRVAGYNLAGLGALTTMDETLTAGRATVDLLGPKGALIFDRATGKRTYTLAESGYLTSDQADLRRVLASGQAAHPWPSVTGRFGEGVGKDVRIMTDLDIGEHSLPVPSGDELLSVSLTWFVPPDAQLYEARVISGGLGAGDRVQATRPPWRCGSTTGLRARTAAWWSTSSIRYRAGGAATRPCGCS